MAIKPAYFVTPAVKSDAGTIAIQTAVALTAIVDALNKIKAGQDPAGELERIREVSGKLERHFDSLSGWTPEP